MAVHDVTSEWETQVSLERKIIEVFVDAMKVIGLPKSLGEIYGLLFISKEPQSLDDVINKLGLSKGSASQGLKMLRDLGAIHEERGSSRRTMYVPEIELKRLVGGFIREQVRPHIESGKGKVKTLLKEIKTHEDKDVKKFYQARLEKMDAWMNRGGFVLPILQKMLGE